MNKQVLRANVIDEYEKRFGNCDRIIRVYDIIANVKDKNIKNEKYLYSFRKLIELSYDSLVKHNHYKAKIYLDRYIEIVCSLDLDITNLHIQYREVINLEEQISESNHKWSKLKSKLDKKDSTSKTILTNLSDSSSLYFQPIFIRCTIPSFSNAVIMRYKLARSK